MVKIHLSRILGEKRITQKQLSIATGIRAATINEMYHEIAERINLDHLDKICEYLECDTIDIVEYIPNRKHTIGSNPIIEKYRKTKR